MRFVANLLLFTCFLNAALKQTPCSCSSLSPKPFTRLFPRPTPGILRLRGGVVSAGNEETKKKNGPKGRNRNVTAAEDAQNATKAIAGKSEKWDQHLNLFQKLMSMSSGGENVLGTLEETYSEGMLQDWNIFVDSTLAPLVKGAIACAGQSEFYADTYRSTQMCRYR